MVFNIVNKIKKYHSVEKVYKSNRKIVERCKIDTTNTKKNAHFPNIII